MQSLKEYKINFFNFVNQENAKLALLLNLIEPKSGGVLLAGKRGTGKSTLIKAFCDILRQLKIPSIQLPMNATEEAVLGGIDIEETIKTGKRVFQRGILSKADGGFLVIEDINLFPQDIFSIVFEVQARGENIIEREGITLREPAQFQIIATMNPEEADFSSHFLDRFGMCVIMDEVRNKDKKTEILKLNALDECHFTEQHQLFKKILRCKEFTKKVKVSDEIKEFIADLILKEAVSGHRGDIYLYYASKAFAAYRQEETVTEEHVKAVAHLVLNHRRRAIEPEPEEEKHEKENETDSSNNSEKRQEQKDREQKIPLSQSQESHDGKSQSIPSSEKEEVFPIGEKFKVKRFIFKKDRIVRQTTGRRTKTKTKGRGGRYVRSLMQKRPDIAIDATLRAAAPFQKLRGMKDNVVIFDDDLRYKEKERRMSHNVIFVVDGSGSMGVEQRMKSTKGAVLSLLIDCYQKRDKVAMIVFRKDRAEIVLPPTSSVELAQRRLKEIPTGGKTPLGAGILEAYKLIKKIRLKELESRFIVIIITDGRGNVSISNNPPLKELESVCILLRGFPHVDFIVIDTENKKGFLKMDMAVKIAHLLEARYATLENIKAEDLTEIVREVHQTA
ncbi:AAA family ATPase [Thermodesulfovibrio sp.]|uniref:AAA family ATPase n=1 Tax=Thermodesulfovibrio sp. TaxID=2067987 RepID=UPI00309FC732